MMGGLSWWQFLVARSALEMAERLAGDKERRISPAERDLMRRWISRAISYAPDPASVRALEPLIAALGVLCPGELTRQRAMVPLEERLERPVVVRAVGGGGHARG
jgi:hypothetical protein